MINQINFKDLVKKIHPDFNPEIMDAGYKMTTAVKFKDNPKYLYKLALSWGIISAKNSFKDNQEYKSSNFRTTNIISFKRSQVIRYGKKGKKGVILRVTPKKGRGKGTGYKVEFVDIVKEKVFHFYTDKMKYVCILGKCTDENFIKAHNIYMNQNFNKREENINHVSKIKRALYKYTPYVTRFDDIYILLKDGFWYRVVKTSAKSVFYYDRTGKRRYVSFKNVVAVKDFK